LVRDDDLLALTVQIWMAPRDPSSTHSTRAPDICFLIVIRRSKCPN